MSQENVELARRLHEEFNRDGWDALWRAAHPEVEFHEPPEQPGANVYRGLESAREGVTRVWHETWAEQRSVAERFIDLGDTVLVLTVQHLVGRDGIEVTPARSQRDHLRRRKDRACQGLLGSERRPQSRGA